MELLCHDGPGSASADLDLKQRECACSAPAQHESKVGRTNISFCNNGGEQMLLRVCSRWRIVTSTVGDY